VFIKGDILFKLEQFELAFKNQDISAQGVSGLTWPPLDPIRDFGKSAQVEVKIHKPQGYSFRVSASILAESTQNSRYMALKFNLSEDENRNFTSFIQKFGNFPTAYIRKYPRIHYSSQLQSFPVRALGTLLNKLPSEETPSDPAIIFDVENLSPNGALICTENSNALSIIPGDHLHLTLEPRGWFTTPIQVQCLVCRTTDELVRQSINISRHFGVKFERISPADKEAFLLLLKHILEQVRPIK